MKNGMIIVAALAGTLLAAPAMAGGKHGGGHGESQASGHADEMAIGKPGKAADVSRTIRMSMFESEEGEMLFEPAKIEVKMGETVRFEIENEGELEHEFVMDTPEAVEEHKALMAKFPEMEHADPNAARMTAGKDGSIVWTFTKAGNFEFACLIPGHYESGMHGTLVVAAK